MVIIKLRKLIFSIIRVLSLIIESTWTDIEKVIQDIKPVLITMDHLRCFHDQDENSSRGMEKVANADFRSFEYLRVYCAYSHHFNKRESGTFYQRLRGSGVIYARSEVAFEIQGIGTESKAGWKVSE